MYQTEESITLKKSADKMVEKFEIIGLNLLGLQKHKNEIDARAEAVERE